MKKVGAQATPSIEPSTIVEDGQSLTEPMANSYKSMAKRKRFALTEILAQCDNLLLIAIRN